MKTDAHWKAIGSGPHHGICVPLFSLRTQKSCGIGEFKDLIPLIDWCKAVGFDTIQLLPLFDSGSDPSPYYPCSAYALDPVYLTLADLGAPIEEFHPFSELLRVAREEVKARKLQWLREYFQKHFDPTDPNYIAFLGNHPWIHSYSVFKAISEAQEERPWNEWPPDAKPASESAVQFHQYLQYLCFLQLSSVRKHASAQNIFLKGDMPYLLNPDSADVWANPHLFDLRLDAGSPPDFYNPEGQHWGFPLFDWNAMRADGFRWWKHRFHAILPYFHLYRIDHVVGLFRIWGIEKGKKAIEGKFVPADESLWEKQGRDALAMMIDSSPLLPMGEDLGTIPPMVRVVLKEFGICGTKIIRWERNWQTDHSFIPFKDYEPFSLTACSTMDSDTLIGWWEKSPDDAKAFSAFKGWDYQPKLSFERHLEILRDSHRTPSRFHINILQDILSLFPDLVSPLPDEERINVPGTISPSNWSYRYRPSIEEMASDERLAKAIREILSP